MQGEHQCATCEETHEGEDGVMAFESGTPGWGGEEGQKEGGEVRCSVIKLSSQKSINEHAELV